MAEQSFVTFCKVSEIPAGKRDVFDLDHISIILFNVDGTFYAVENRCSHEEVELYHGELSECTLECTKHGATFDIRTGAALTAPAFEPVKVFAVRVIGDEVQVAI